jgi:ATP-binding cassette subfamily B protein
VLVDGTDVREMTQQDLRNRIGYVPQKALLFTGTINDNISFGSKEHDGETVEAALSTSQSSEFVDLLAEKSMSILAQGGRNLSGGQKQRLSIARALFRKPGIFIFDDSFSALDFKTDAALRAALKDETKKSTVIIIAHRVATVLDADRIVVLDEGKTAGIGTHKELMKMCEVYREIVYSQLSQEELA